MFSYFPQILLQNNLNRIIDTLLIIPMHHPHQCLLPPFENIDFFLDNGLDNFGFLLFPIPLFVGQIDPNRIYYRLRREFIVFQCQCLLDSCGFFERANLLQSCSTSGITHNQGLNDGRVRMNLNDGVSDGFGDYYHMFCVFRLVRIKFRAAGSHGQCGQEYDFGFHCADV